MKRIAILGSTGSIGCNTLHILKHLKDSFRVVALAAKQNIDLLEEQAKAFHPELIAVFDEKKAMELQRRLPSITVLAGMEGLEAVASINSADMVVSAISGTMGLAPTVAAICAGHDVALANKEALVSGGSYVMDLVKKHGVNLIPVDSEHSALFQCLQGEEAQAVHRLILTASGGPFRSKTAEELSAVTVKEALNHPTWAMGPKVTVDSSTLMNKGLEVIEAHWLFNISVEKISVVIHPQSIIHSMVEFVDHSLLAQLGETTMLTPIQYALTYPKRVKGILKPFDITEHETLQFYKPDMRRFPCLALAFEAIKVGASLPCYMNAANEVLVQRFLDKKLSWKEIGNKLETLLERHHAHTVTSIDAIAAVDTLAREEASLV